MSFNARSFKAQLAWIVKGGGRTEASLQQLGNDLRELQQKVESLSTMVDRLDAQVAAGIGRADVQRMEGSVAELRNQLRAVTDDLGDRVGAVSAFLKD